MEIMQMLAALLESLAAEIRAAGKQDDYCSVTIYPGSEVPLDIGPESDCQGTAYIRLVAANPTVSFPSADTSLNNCHYSLAFTLEMAIYTAAPVLEDHLGHFTLPTDVEQFEATQRMTEEMMMMYRAIRGAGIPQLVLGDYVPQGPSGGLIGGTWSLTVGGDGDD